MPKKKYPNNLRHYRIKRRLTQQEAALAIGHSSAGRISEWENGSSAPNVENMMRLSALYRVSIDKLYAPLARRMHRPKKKEAVAVARTDSNAGYASMNDEQLVDALAEMIVIAYLSEQ